jgi:hypothetical protein
MTDTLTARALAFRQLHADPGLLRHPQPLGRRLGPAAGPDGLQGPGVHGAQATRSPAG